MSRKYRGGVPKGVKIGRICAAFVQIGCCLSVFHYLCSPKLPIGHNPAWGDGGHWLRAACVVAI